MSGAAAAEGRLQWFVNAVAVKFAIFLKIEEAREGGRAVSHLP